MTRIDTSAPASPRRWRIARSLGTALFAWAMLAAVPDQAAATTFTLQDLRAFTSPDLEPAVAALRAGEVETARRTLKDIISANPANRPARVLLAFTHLRDDPALAARLAADILVAGYRDDDALGLLSAAQASLRETAGSVARELAFRDAFVRLLDTATDHHPGWPNAIYQAATQRIAIHRLDPARTGDLAIATRDLGQLVDVLDVSDLPAKTRAVIWFQYGRALKHIDDDRPVAATPADLTGNYSRAIDAFRKVTALDPRRIDAIGETVLILRRLGRTKDAQQAIAAGLTRLVRDYDGPDLGQLTAHLTELEAALLVETGDTTAAEAAFRRALDADPSRYGAALHLSDLQDRAGQPVAARETLESALTAVPGFLEGWEALARMAEARGDTDAAVAAYTRLLQVTPGDTIAIGMRPSPERYRADLRYRAAKRLARLELDRKAPEAALHAASLARTFQAPDTDLQVTVAEIFEALGRRDHAIERLRWLIGQGDNAQARKVLTRMEAEARAQGD